MSLKIIKKDIWDIHNFGETIVVTTNGTVRRDGCAVMGAGVAKEAKERYPNFPFELGYRLKEHGNYLFYFKKYALPLTDKSIVDSGLLFKIALVMLSNLGALLKFCKTVIN